MKKDKQIKPKDKAELALEKAVFGDSEGFESGLRSLDLDNDFDLDQENDSEESSGEGQDLENIQDDNLFFIDEGSDNDEENEDVEMKESPETEKDVDQEDVDQEPAVWEDSDDEKMQISLTSIDKLRKLRTSLNDNSVNGKEYSKRLRSRFEKIYPVPKWAKPQQENEDDDESDLDEEDEDSHRADPLAKLLKTATSYISKAAPKTIAPTQINISRLKDANHSAIAKSAIQTLHFHPTHPLLLASGYDKTLRMFHIDGKSNPVATTLHVKQSPFQTAQFHPDGRRVFAAGRRRYLYMWDIETGDVTKISRMYGHEQKQRSMENFKLSPCGRYIGLIGGNGWMNVLSATNGQWIAGAKVEGVIADIAWFSDGEHALIANTNGEVWQWNVESRSFVGRWKDEGGIGTTRISLCKDRWCAIGSTSGMVNIYDLENMEESMRMSDTEVTYKPRATLDQLVTTITSLQFSSDGQILVMASRAKRDALRLVHLPSFTVYQNWPTSGTPLGRVTSVSFTPGNQMLCTANEAGHARLWNLEHYAL